MSNILPLPSPRPPRAKPLIVSVDSVSIPVYSTPTGKYPAFTVAYRADGKRIRRKFSTLAEAKTFADDQATKISRGLRAAMGLDGRDAASYARAQELLEPFNVPLEIAVSEYAQMRQMLGPVSPVDAARDYVRRHPPGLALLTPAEVLQEFVAAKATISPRWLIALDRMLTAFATAFPVPLSHIPGREINAWLQGLRAKDGSPLGQRSRANYCGAVRELFTFAQRRRYLPREHDELAAIDRIDAPAGKIQVYSPEEMTTLLHHAAKHSPRAVAYLALRAFCGIRFEEMSRLQVSHIHLSTHCIALTADITKTGASRLVPITPALGEWLRRYLPKRGPVQTFAQMSNKLVKMVRAAGLENRHNGLRDSFISYRVALLGDIPKVAQESGNSPDMIRDSYRELRMPDGRIITASAARRYFGIRPEVCPKSVTKKVTPPKKPRQSA